MLLLLTMIMMMMVVVGPPGEKGEPGAPGQPVSAHLVIDYVIPHRIRRLLHALHLHVYIVFL